MKKLIVILFTTKYRKGGEQFRKVAETMSLEKSDDETEIICKAIESKKEIKGVLYDIAQAGKQISEFHFIGHSGMYGPMYGTVEFPEQFSPYELKNLSIPFAKGAEATFHCCRSARWFAPYFARVQDVKTMGYHWYTVFSSKKDRYQFPRKNAERLYSFGCPGKKSHGLMASLKKYLGLTKAETLKAFEPETDSIDSSYNSVAELYAQVFEDIKVRKDEFNWIIKQFPNKEGLRVLDIGCGNGALLRELSPRIENGIGVDVSEQLINQAKKQNANTDNLAFKTIDGPELPFEADSFDVVVSLLSFRYLDWDPMMLEIERVLKSDGKLMIVDMVTAPVRLKEFPAFIRGKLKHYIDRLSNPAFHQKLGKLVSDPRWSTMLKYNPIRSQHEMKWYLESRFPGRKVKVINVGWHSRILALDSVDMKDINNISLTYP